MPFFSAALNVSPWREHARGVLVLTAASAAFTYAVSWHSTHLGRSFGRNRATPVAIESPPPLLLRDIAPEDAVRINRSIALSDEPNPAARPFHFSGGLVAYDRALECLTDAVYYEAGSEAVDGQRAVAQVVLNRVRHPAFPASVCAVVFQGSTRRTGCQFSFTCDHSLQRSPGTSVWTRSRAIARAAIAGAVFAPVGYATHYHADYVVPYWATSLAKNGVVGAHNFYRWPGWWGQPTAFSKAYAGKEPDPLMLRKAALGGGQNGPLLADRGSASEGSAVGADPRVELASIIQFLAAKSPTGDGDSAYATEVRKYFSIYSDHLAVQIYRQLSARDDQLSLPAFIQIVMNYSPPPDLELRGPVQADLVKAAGGQEKLAGLISALRDFAKFTDFETFFRDQQPMYTELAARVRPPAIVLATKLDRGAGMPVAPCRLIFAPLRHDILVRAPLPICETIAPQL